MPAGQLISTLERATHSYWWHPVTWRAQRRAHRGRGPGVGLPGLWCARAVCVVLGTVGLSSGLASTHHTPSCGNPDCLQTWPLLPWGQAEDPQGRGLGCWEPLHAGSVGASATCLCLHSPAVSVCSCFSEPSFPCPPTATHGLWCPLRRFLTVFSQVTVHVHCPGRRSALNVTKICYTPLRSPPSMDFSFFGDTLPSLPRPD